MEMPLESTIILYVDIGLMGLIAIVLLGWQVMVLRGRSMKNADGSVDNWHEQKLLYGMATADIVLGVPVTLAGILLIVLDVSVGFYVMGMVSFWFLWINTATTVTSLRFEKPRLTLNWFIVFPLGAILGLVYIVWSLVFFKEAF